MTIFFPDKEIIQVENEKVRMFGTAKETDGLQINGDPIPIHPETGAWEKEIMLQEGLNTFEISAKKFLGKTIIIRRQIIYAPPPEARLEPISKIPPPAI